MTKTNKHNKPLQHQGLCCRRQQQIYDKATVNEQQSLLCSTNLLFWQGFGAVVRSHREPLRPAGQSHVTPVSAPSQQAPWAHTLHEWHPASMASPCMREASREQQLVGEAEENDKM